MPLVLMESKATCQWSSTIESRIHSNSGFRMLSRAVNLQPGSNSSSLLCHTTVIVSESLLLGTTVDCHPQVNGYRHKYLIINCQNAKMLLIFASSLQRYSFIMASWSMDAYYYHLSSSAETLFVAVSSIIEYCGSICNKQGALSHVCICVFH